MSEEIANEIVKEIKQKSRYTGSRKAKTGNRRRSKSWRDREKENAVTAEEQEAFDDRRLQRGLICFGETEPLVNCGTISEEIQIAREFSAAMNGPDIEPGQVPRDYISDVFRMWVERECPAYDRSKKKFAFLVNFKKPDLRKYIWPEGADDPFQPVDISVLGDE